MGKNRAHRVSSPALIPCDYRKPDDTPLRELAATNGARPNEFLLIGDAVNDLEVVDRDKVRPRAIFCLQAKGSAEISDELSAFNARLRPGYRHSNLAQ